MDSLDSQAVSAALNLIGYENQLADLAKSLKESKSIPLPNNVDKTAFESWITNAKSVVGPVAWPLTSWSLADVTTIVADLFEPDNKCKMLINVALDASHDDFVHLDPETTGMSPYTREPFIVKLTTCLFAR